MQRNNCLEAAYSFFFNLSAKIMKNYLIIIIGFILVTCASSNVPIKKGSFEDLIIAGKDVFFKDKNWPLCIRMIL